MSMWTVTVFWQLGKERCVSVLLALWVEVKEMIEGEANGMMAQSYELIERNTKKISFFHCVS